MPKRKSKSGGAGAPAKKATVTNNNKKDKTPDVTTTMAAPTNEEHQERILTGLTNPKWGRKIFDTLIEWGALTKKELAAILHTRANGPVFFYAEQELRKSNYIEKDTKGKKLRLTDAAFLNPKDRPATTKTDPEELCEIIAQDTAAWEAKKNARDEAKEARDVKRKVQASKKEENAAKKEDEKAAKKEEKVAKKATKKKGEEAIKNESKKVIVKKKTKADSENVDHEDEVGSSTAKKLEEAFNDEVNEVVVKTEKVEVGSDSGGGV